MLNHVDINCDMGEDPTSVGYNIDHLFMPFISSCNISCGEHSGTLELIEKTIVNAIHQNINIGAHPSYPDRENFGRLVMDISNDELLLSIKKQLITLTHLVKSKGGQISHIKAHGALYHQLNHNESLANSYIKLISRLYDDIIIYGISGSILESACNYYKVTFISEVFADRRYKSKSKLVSRNIPNAVITQEQQLKDQLHHLLNNTVADLDGHIHPIKTETICLHSDTENALDICKTISAYLKTNHVKVRPYSK